MEREKGKQEGIEKEERERRTKKEKEERESEEEEKRRNNKKERVSANFTYNHRDPSVRCSCQDPSSDHGSHHAPSGNSRECLNYCSNNVEQTPNVHDPFSAYRISEESGKKRGNGHIREGSLEHAELRRHFNGIPRRVESTARGCRRPTDGLAERIHLHGRTAKPNFDPVQQSPERCNSNTHESVFVHTAIADFILWFLHHHLRLSIVGVHP